MRLKNREITDLNEIYYVMRQCEVCRVAMHDEVYPYIVPMNFGMETNGQEVNLYFHTALEGKKITLLRKNPHVAFEMDCEHELYVNDSNTMCSMAYASVMGEGVIEEIPTEDKKQIMEILLSQYPKHKDVKYHEKVLEKVILWRLKVENISGKRSRKGN